MRIWVLTDGKIGDRVQCLGVVSRLGEDADEKIISPGRPWEWWMPRGPVPPKHRPERDQSPISPPFPDVAIASGRRLVPYLKAIKKASGGKTYTVFLKDPRIGASAADLIWVPRHDRLRAENVLVTDTGPHPLTKEILTKASSDRPPDWNSLPSPRMGLLIGNPVSGARDQTAGINQFMAQIDHARSQVGSIIVTQSRRTPEAVMTALRQRLDGYPHWIWSPENENPYRALLGFCDLLAVTGDSHNMVSEALSTGKPVFPMVPCKLNPKLAFFLNRLQEAGLTRPFDGPLEAYNYERVDATEEIAEAIRCGLAARRHKPV